MKTDTITDTQIRLHLLEDIRNDKVRISRNGLVYVRTDRERGDGGRRPWWMFAGFRRDLVCDVRDSIASAVAR